MQVSKGVHIYYNVISLNRLIHTYIQSKSLTRLSFIKSSQGQIQETLYKPNPTAAILSKSNVQPSLYKPFNTHEINYSSRLSTLFITVTVAAILMI